MWKDVKGRLHKTEAEAIDADNFIRLDTIQRSVVSNVGGCLYDPLGKLIDGHNINTIARSMVVNGVFWSQLINVYIPKWIKDEEGKYVG